MSMTLEEVRDHYRKVFRGPVNEDGAVYAFFGGETGTDKLNGLLFMLKNVWPLAGMEKGRVRITYMFDPDCPRSIVYLETPDHPLEGIRAEYPLNPPAELR